VSNIQEESAERGKQAAEAYKTMDKVLNQQVRAKELRKKRSRIKPIMPSGERRTILFLPLF
jgi:hypothetical protein